MSTSRSTAPVIEAFNQSGNSPPATTGQVEKPYTPPSPWITVPEAATHARVSTDTIYVACASQRLRHTKVGGRKAIRLKVEWIDEWLERHAVAA